MAENKTATHHIYHKGIYVYACKQGKKTRLIILNGSNDEQYLPVEHCRELLAYIDKAKKFTCAAGVELTEHMKLNARQSIIIEL